MSDRLALLAGQSPDAQALLQAAAEGVISGPDLEAHLLTHAGALVFASGMGEALKRAMDLEEVVNVWDRYDNDPKLEPDFNSHEEVDAEVLAVLFDLVTGRAACRWCLRGWLIDIDHLEPEGDCSQHTTKQVAA